MLKLIALLAGLIVCSQMQRQKDLAANGGKLNRDNLSLPSGKQPDDGTFCPLESLVYLYSR